ncbi:Protein of unknown function [Gryllus bimaculatus]|nr:Protein of unknown function [Gryllus bimaculatus]
MVTMRRKAKQKSETIQCTSGCLTFIVPRRQKSRHFSATSKLLILECSTRYATTNPVMFKSRGFNGNETSDKENIEAILEKIIVLKLNLSSRRNYAKSTKYLKRRWELFFQALKLLWDCEIRRQCPDGAQERDYGHAVVSFSRRSARDQVLRSSGCRLFIAPLSLLASALVAADFKIVYCTRQFCSSMAAVCRKSPGRQPRRTGFPHRDPTSEICLALKAEYPWVAIGPCNRDAITLRSLCSGQAANTMEIAASSRRRVNQPPPQPMRHGAQGHAAFISPQTNFCTFKTQHSVVDSFGVVSVICKYYNSTRQLGAKASMYMKFANWVCYRRSYIVDNKSYGKIVELVKT